MRESPLLVASIRCFAILVTLVFVGGFNPPAPAYAALAVASCIQEPETSMALGELIALFALLGLLAVLLLTGIERCRAVKNASDQSRAFENRALTALFYHRAAEARDAAKFFPESPVALLVRAGIEQDDASAAGHQDHRPAFLRCLVAKNIELKRHLWIVAAAGWSAPIVGLIAEIDSRYASHSAFFMCFGLTLGVSAIWLYRGLTSQVELLLLETDRMSLSIIEQINEQLTKFDNHQSFGHHPPREIRLPLPSRHTSPLC